MSNYVKLTDFASKDSLTTGNPLKLIKGTEINDEFNAIQTAVATKADLASPALLGNPTAPTQTLGNNTTRLATTAFVQTALQALHPIGSIYISVISTNPNTLFGFGTWVAFASGRTLVGIDLGNTLIDTVEETFGSSDSIVVSHTHTLTDPGHSHSFINGGQINGGASGSGGVYADSRTVSTNSSTTGVTIASAGESGINKNYQPSIAVFMWKRVS